jgi:hypothetical protein
MPPATWPFQQLPYRCNGPDLSAVLALKRLIAPNVTLRAEYLYMRTFDDTSTISGAQLTSHLSDNIFRVAVNFKPSR